MKKEKEKSFWKLIGLDCPDFIYIYFFRLKNNFLEICKLICEQIFFILLIS